MALGCRLAGWPKERIIYMMLRRLFALMIVLLPIFIIGKIAHGQSQEVTDEVIAMNCQQSQAYLKNDLKNRDLKTRVDRLRAYQHIQKRVDHFVSRLEKHRQPNATEMRLIVSQLDLAITSFKVNYEAYDAVREKLANLSDCSGRVSEFRELLSSSRTELRKVRQSADSIETLINERFMRGLDQLEAAMGPQSEGEQ